MAVVVKKKAGDKEWWVFVNIGNKRRSVRVGPRRKTADHVADRIRYKIALEKFDIAPKKTKTDIDYLVFCEIRNAVDALDWLKRSSAQRKKEIENGN